MGIVSSMERATSLHVSSIVRLPPSERAKALQQLTDAEAQALLYDWCFWARPEQLRPELATSGLGDWIVWLYLAGRGAGKTRSGAEWVRARVKAGHKHIALIAPTTADARKVMVEGVSGILSCCWPCDRLDDGTPLGIPEYSPANRAVTWSNGAVATTFSAEEPDRLRGPQHDTIWADELAAWERARETWDMAMFGLRLGDDPRAMVTTTPKPIPLVRELIKDSANAVTRGTTWDNRVSLAETFFKTVVSKYQGTRLGRQELSGEVLKDVEGALWSREMIRRLDKAPDLLRIVVAVDPPASSGDGSAQKTHTQGVTRRRSAIVGTGLMPMAVLTRGRTAFCSEPTSTSYSTSAM